MEKHSILMQPSPARLMKWQSFPHYNSNYVETDSMRTLLRKSTECAIVYIGDLHSANANAHEANLNQSR